MNVASVSRIGAVVLLVAMGAHRVATARRPARVDQYHARIRAAALTVPHRIEEWVGEDVPVPPQAVNLLTPNLIISRRYVNVEDGSSASVLLVHCADTHDILGHYPPRCFPGQGWEQKSARPRDWSAGDLRLTGTEYEFRRSDGAGGLKGESTVVIANCLLRPGGRVLRNMDGLTGSASDGLLGAGQIQIYFERGVPEDRRDAAVAALAGGYRPVLDAILAEVPN